MTDFSAETLHAMKECNGTFKIIKDKNYQLKILYPAKLSVNIKGDIKVFTDIQKLMEFRITSPALKNMLKRDHQGERKRWKYTNLQLRW